MVTYVQYKTFSQEVVSLERLSQASKELSEATGRRCTFAQADVRQPAQLRAAVDKAISTYGRIDFVICGMHALARSTPRRRLISHAKCQQVPLEISWLLFLVFPKTGLRLLLRLTLYVRGMARMSLVLIISL